MDTVSQVLAARVQRDFVVDFRYAFRARETLGP